MSVVPSGKYVENIIGKNITQFKQKNVKKWTTDLSTKRFMMSQSLG